MILHKTYSLSKYNVEIYIDQKTILSIDLPESLGNNLEIQHFPKDLIGLLEGVDEIKHVKVYDKSDNLLMFRTRVVEEDDLNLF